MEFLFEYGLFLAKSATVVVTIGLIAAIVFANSGKAKGGKKGTLELTDLGEKYEDHELMMQEQLLTEEEIKQARKDEKKRLKEEKKQAKKKGDDKADEVLTSRVFVLKFNGSVDAHEVESLREEVSAILSVADKERDEVLLKLESGGGVVHGYGLAASQLDRLKKAEIPLTVVVDKVAASGGYMMACLADKLFCAPFAIIGSIGVIAQVPNFNKLLKKHDVEFEQITAGEYKRTLTMFGENTDKAREKFQLEIDEVHGLFKDFVQRYRPELDLAKVATGEHWFGAQALELGLVDELATSDELLGRYYSEDKELHLVEFVARKKLSEKVAENVVSSFVSSATNKLMKIRHWYQ
ncbi:protease SohB [Echinimonas agarilytica]|uniref:Protease SohB n=1 Tax=Echinimonas agarilytica TaxID=1215918 RepID=A0AA41W6Z2_9GAMM|nr:protease SohB [Echinimonas agarilytica]MCM2679756.1 protease SohB [Echinimonas agarilytica]